MAWGLVGWTNCSMEKFGPGTWCISHFSCVLDSLDAKKDQAQRDGQQQIDDQALLSAHFGAVDTHRHRQAGANQHRGIDRAQRDVERVAASDKRGVVPVAVDQVGQNMPPKNMISVSRNTHMPKLAASRCCSTVSKWWQKVRRVRECRCVRFAGAWLQSRGYPTVFTSCAVLFASHS